MLRSCYAADMQFYFDSPATLPIVWYFVPDDRATLPFSTVFSSRIYDRDDEPQLPIGELYKPVPWRGGQAPGPVASSGNCGNANAWLKGVSINDRLPDVWPGTDVPKCCAAPPPQFFGEGGGGGIMSEPFRGEAAGGGRVVEPAIGEAAGGGVFALVEPFTGEAGGGGRVVEPAIGEAAGGGIFSTVIPMAGGGAGGGSYAIVEPFTGGGSGGGDFTAEPSGGFTSDCDPDQTLPLSVTAVFTNDNDIWTVCPALEGLTITATHPGIYVAWSGVDADWSSEPFVIWDWTVVMSIVCNEDTSRTLIFTDVDDSGIRYASSFNSETTSYSPYAITFFLFHPNTDTGDEDCNSSRCTVQIDEDV
jgi:hypothetical protein